MCKTVNIQQGDQELRDLQEPYGYLKTWHSLVNMQSMHTKIF